MLDRCAESYITNYDFCPKQKKLCCVTCPDKAECPVDPVHNKNWKAAPCKDSPDCHLRIKGDEY